MWKKCHCECDCGGIDETHTLESPGCYRKSIPTPIVVDGTDKYVAGGKMIHKRILIIERGYHRHKCGHWSGWNDSGNSSNA